MYLLNRNMKIINELINPKNKQNFKIFVFLHLFLMLLCSWFYIYLP